MNKLKSWMAEARITDSSRAFYVTSDVFKSGTVSEMLSYLLDEPVPAPHSPAEIVAALKLSGRHVEPDDENAVWHVGNHHKDDGKGPIVMFAVKPDDMILEIGYNDNQGLYGSSYPTLTEALNSNMMGPVMHGAKLPADLDRMTPLQGARKFVAANQNVEANDGVFMSIEMKTDRSIYIEYSWKDRNEDGWEMYFV